MATAKKKLEASPSPRTKAVRGISDAEYPSLYTNFMGVGISPFDISILFAEIDQREAGPRAAVPQMKVMMAPEQAANLVVMLTQAINQYVAANGPLRHGGRMALPDEK